MKTPAYTQKSNRLHAKTEVRALFRDLDRIEARQKSEVKTLRASVAKWLARIGAKF